MFLTQAHNYLASDEVFDALYPVYIQKLSGLHWTPLNVAKTAAQFLAPDADARVIDIGAGSGKFCIAGSFFSNATFTGVEHRKHFVQIGNKVARQLGRTNVELLHANFMEIDMSQYTGIYFYNSFHENLALSESLDDKVSRSPELYDLYTASFINRLNDMPIGTRLATFWLSVTEIPGCYRLYESHYNNLLKLWKKEY